MICLLINPLKLSRISISDRPNKPTAKAGNINRKPKRRLNAPAFSTAGSERSLP